MDNEPLWKQIQRAIKNGDVKATMSLLREDESRLHMDTSFGTWLHIAAKHGQLEIARRLVKMGADINAPGGTAYSFPLDAAASAGQLEVVKYLLSEGAILDTTAPERNPLFGAIHGRHTEVARLLIAGGIDVHATYMGWSGRRKNALSFAMEYGNKEIVDLLAAAGCTLPPAEEVVPGTGNLATDHERIIETLQEYLGPVEQLCIQEIFPVDDEVHVAIHLVRPNAKCPFLTLFTTGMSDKPMHVPDGEDHQYAELLVQLPPNWPLAVSSLPDKEHFWPIEWLRRIAYFPHHNQTWLGGRYTIISNEEPPRPLGPNTAQTCWLLVADFADCSPIDLGGKKQVHFYTLNSIYTEERDLERSKNLWALLERFSDNEILSFVDPTRENVVLQRKIHAGTDGPPDNPQ